MSRALALLPVLVAAVLSGCPAATPQTGLQPTYTSLSQNVFVGCSTSGCHGGTSPAADLNLTADQAHAALVGVLPDNAQARADGLLRVSAGNPSQSFLLTKLHPITKPAYGSRMPVGGRLSEAQITAVTQWIEKGAPKD